MTPDEFAAITARMDRAENSQQRLTASHQDMRHDMVNIRIELAENTSVTKEIRDYMAGIKVAIKIGGGFAAFCRWVAAIGAAVGTVYGALHFWPHK